MRVVGRAGEEVENFSVVWITFFVVVIWLEDGIRMTQRFDTINYNEALKSLVVYDPTQKKKKQYARPFQGRGAIHARQVKARPSITFLLSFPYLWYGTETMRFCMRSTGRALGFINIEAAVMKLLLGDIRKNLKRDQMKDI
jgi:hypothetical protein